MLEYFELYKILEDGEVEHIDQICINDKNIFQTIYDNFKELQDYVNNDYFANVYDIELKKYLINTNKDIYQKIPKKNIRKRLELIKERYDLKRLLKECW